MAAEELNCKWVDDDKRVSARTRINNKYCVSYAETWMVTLLINHPNASSASGPVLGATSGRQNLGFLLRPTHHR